MRTIKAGPLKRIHVNGALLRSGTDAKRPLVVYYRDDRTPCAINTAHVAGDGPFELVYRPEVPFGVAVVWIETRCELRISP